VLVSALVAVAIGGPAPDCGPAYLTAALHRWAPATAPRDACDIARASWGAGRAYHLDPLWLLRLVALESSGRKVHRWYPPALPRKGPNLNAGASGRADLGWWQVHSTTALAFDCDVPGLLAFDAEASATCAARVLAHALHQCGHVGAAWVGCYHSATPWRRDAYAAKFWSLRS
jgi:hypothetical protein